MLGDVVIDIRHVGSADIRNICAKPIIDIAVGQVPQYQLSVQKGGKRGCASTILIVEPPFFTDPAHNPDLQDDRQPFFACCAAVRPWNFSSQHSYCGNQTCHRTIPYLHIHDSCYFS